jgi:hypothetical protein
MSKTVDTDPMTPIARQTRTQSLRGRVDTQPLPMRVDTEATGASARSSEASSPPGSDAKLPIAVPSTGAVEEEPPPPSNRAPSSQRFDTQPFPLRAEPAHSPEREDTAANDSSPPTPSRTEVRPKFEASSDPPPPLGAEAPLRKEDLPALFASIAHTMREPNARIDPPASEELRYIPPRRLRAKNQTPAREQRVVVRRSVMEPVVVPPRSSEAAGAPSLPRADAVPPPTKRNVQTVLTKRVARRRISLPGVLTAAAVAVIGAGALIFALRRSEEDPLRVAPPRVSVASSARVEPTDTATPSQLPPPADLPATTASAPHEDVTPAPTPRVESSPSRVVRASPAVLLIPSPLAPPVVPTQSNRLRAKSVQPAASPAPSAAAAKPVPHADIFDQERSE